MASLSRSSLSRSISFIRYCSDTSWNTSTTPRMSPAVVPNGRGAVGYLEFPPIPRKKSRVVGQGHRPPRGQDLPHGGENVSPCLSIDDVEDILHGPARPFFGLPARKEGCGGIHAGDPAGGVRDDHGIPDGMKGDVEIGFALAQFPGPFPSPSARESPAAR